MNQIESFKSIKESAHHELTTPQEIAKPLYLEFTLPVVEIVLMKGVKWGGGVARLSNTAGQCCVVSWESI